jgi:concanavalin A-like lectin/glucanase superfamily protein
MKRQILFITIATFSTVLFSCSKDHSILPVAESAPQESNAASVTPERSMYINPLAVHLDACYPFNGNLNEATGKLGPGVSFGLAAQYTPDRKGFANSALRLTGNSFVKIFNVPQQTASSISVWVRTYDLNQNLGIVTGPTQGLILFQNPNLFIGGLTLVKGGISISTGLNKTVSDLNWHHLVVTYDGTSFKFYVDGILAGSSNMAGSLASALATYIIGNGYWKGAIDDLRFYSRTLTASDVTALYNL